MRKLVTLIQRLKCVEWYCNNYWYPLAILCCQLCYGLLFDKSCICWVINHRLGLLFKVLMTRVVTKENTAMPATNHLTKVKRQWCPTVVHILVPVIIYIKTGDLISRHI